MKYPKLRIAVPCLLLVTCLLAAGCQSTGNWLASRFKSSGSKSKIARNEQVPQLPPPETITADKRASIQMTMARAHERQGNVERAFALYEEAIKSEPKSAVAHHRLAVLHDRHGQVDESHEHYLIALKLDPQNATVHSDYGYSCYLQGRLAEAERHLRQAVTLDSKNARAHNNLGILLARNGKANLALGEFHLAGCTESEARVNLAMGMLAEGRFDDANQQLATASNLRRISPETHAKLIKMQSLVARVDKRDAAPLPPTTKIGDGNAPPAGAEVVTRIPTVAPSPTINFVGSAPPVGTVTR